MTGRSKSLWFFVVLGLMVTMVNLLLHVRHTHPHAATGFLVDIQPNPRVPDSQPTPPLEPTLHVVTEGPHKKHRHKRNHHGRHISRGGSNSTSRHRKRGRNGSDIVKKRHAFNYNATDEAGNLLFSTTSFAAALKSYEQFIEKHLDVEIEQSSRKFSDIFENPDHGIILPSSSPALEKIATYEDNPRGDLVLDESDFFEEDSSGNPAAKAAACEPSDNDFSLERDKDCQEYMGDIRNWHSIKAMSSILSTGRTIKFKVFFKHMGISAVLKVSQKKFALEPSSEVIAFHIDRMLSIFRVPPILWIPVPVKFLQAACGAMTAFYAQWFKRFVLEYETNRALLRHQEQQYGLYCLNASLQIWMNDVHDRDETLLTPPEHFGMYLTAIGSPDGDEERDAAKSKSSIHWSTLPLLVNLTLRELVIEFAFDYIIGNTDRWFGHNSFAYGGCIKVADDPRIHDEGERERFYGKREEKKW